MSQSLFSPVDITTRVEGFVSSIPGDLPVELMPAAVLLALVERQGVPHVVFTRRSMTVATHKGQISFPGGMMEPADASVAHAALRETREEIGVPEDRVRVLGYLPGMRTVTDFWVVPVVGVVAGEPAYIVATEEVSDVFEISLQQLADPANRTVAMREYEGYEYLDCRFETSGGTIWGATGKILESFMNQLFPPAGTNS